MSKYIGKNINTFLLIVILISILSTVGVSTYFNKRYEGISNEHRNITFELKKTQNELIAAKNELTNLRGTLDQTSTDVEKYDTLYTDKVNELSSTQDNLVREKAENARLKSDLSTATNALDNEQKKNNQLLLDVAKLEDDIEDLENDKKACSINLNACTDAYPGCDE